MSKSIDSRVVEMRFDNKQFEAGAKQTMGTLSKLKEALKLPNTEKALQGIDKATKNISLDGIAAGVDALNKRFSTLGIVGMRVIQNITDGLMNKVGAAVNFVTDSIVSGGVKRAMNIENAHFQLQALLKDETKVQAVMSNAMEAVDGTAYAYDEAAKAASQFAASGIQAGEEMLGALKGVTGVAAMTNSDFQSISQIFTTVAGQGRLMGDQLLQLASRGLNAASTLADYFKEVRGQSDMTEARIREMVSKGELDFRTFAEAMTWAFGDSAKRANETFTGALSNMKSALARIGAGFISPLVEQNGELVQLFNALRIKINDVKAALVFDEQKSAVAGLAKATGLASDEISKMFDNVKEKGHVTGEEFKMLANNGVHASETLMKYINGVNDGSIRASYAVKSAIEEFTNGTKVSISDVRRYVEEGKVDLAMFTSAMESEFGTERKLSKQFTDWFQDHIHRIVEAINNADMTKPMEIFYHWVEITKNLIKGLLSIVKPLGGAFSDIFLSFGADDIITFSEAIEKLTSNMKLSEKGSKNLKDTMKGLLSVVKLGADIFFKLLGAIIPINKPVVELGGGFLDLTGSIGRALTAFADMIRSSTLLKRGFDLLSTGFSKVMEIFSKLINKARELGSSISELEGTKKLIDSINNALRNFSRRGEKYLSKILDGLEDLLKILFNVEDINIDKILNDISVAFSNLSKSIDGFSFGKIGETFDSFREKIEDLKKALGSNEGITSYIKNFKEYSNELENAFTIDNLLKRMEKFMDVFGKFFNWVRNTMAPAFSDFNVGSAIAGAGGLGIIYAIIKVSKSFEGAVKSIKAIPDLFGAVKGTLVAYQKDLNASALIKIAGAIALLAGSLVLLSFTDVNRLMTAAKALAVVSGVLLFGIAELLEAANKGKEVSNALDILSSGLSNALTSFGKSLKIRAVGSTVKKFAESIAIIAVSIIALGVMYKKDKDSLMAGVKLVELIGVVMTLIMASMSILGNLLQGGGMANFSKAALGILSLSLSLTIVISALNKLFKMEFPSDWEFKVKVLAGMLGGLGVLALALGMASGVAGSGKVSSLAILSMAALLMTTVIALNKLFKMEFPSDWKTKMNTLVSIFVMIGGLMIAIGAASRLAGGAIKAAGTILSMAVFIGVIVASLMVLTLIPTEKLIKGATALGIVLTTLGIALYGAGKIANKDAIKAVLNMAIMVGTITASLAVLSMIPFSKLLTSSIALGGILFALADGLRQASKITNPQAWVAILAMIAAVLSIAYSINALAYQPWENLLAAGVSLSAVLLSISGVFAIISMATPNPVAIGLFLASCLSLIPIALAIYELSKQPWQNLLAAGESISVVLLSMASAMAVCTVVGAAVGPALIGIGLLDLFIMNFGLILVALGKLFETEGAKKLLSGGANILVQIGQAIGDFVGAIINGVLTGISSALPQIGIDLSNFMTNLSGFIEGTKNIDPDMLSKIGFLTGAIIALTAAEVVNGIASLFGISLVDFANELSQFMVALLPFIVTSGAIKEDSIIACKNLAEMILVLTGAEILAGIANFFGIGGNLKDFAKELVDFGPAIAQFAETVKNVKPESVQGAASAAEIMATVATKLQAHGGWFQSIAGDKSLSTFAKELVDFGPAIAQFAETVKNVKPESVQGAASAAEIMATVAEKLPSQGGLAEKIFGSKKLSEFGEELVAFGPKIVEFAGQVTGVNPFAVMGAASVTSIMTNLANNLPDSNTLAQKIFGGGQKSISQFGEELVKFGSSMVNFSNSVSAVNVSQISGAIESFKKLINLAELVQNTSGKSLTQFASDLEKIGVDAITKFTTVFTNSDAKVSSAFQTFVNKASSSLNEKFDRIARTTMVNIGKNLIDGVIRGLDAKRNDLYKTASSLGKLVDTALCATLQIHSPSKVGETRGEQVDEGVAKGLGNKAGEVKKEASNVGSSLTNGLTESIVSGTVKVNSALNDSLAGEQLYWDGWNEIGKEGVKEDEEVSKEVVSNKKETTSSIKKTNDEAIVVESDYWSRLLEMRRQGAESEKYLEMSMADFRKNTLEEVTAVYEEYNNKVKSSTESIMGAFDLFTGVTRKEAVSADDLTMILEDQIQLYEEYVEQLNMLNERVDNEPLLEELKSLGVDSVDQLRVINSMTDEELSYYSDLYNQKLSAAGEAATAQLSTMQQQTEAKISELLGAMNTQISMQDFSSMFDGTIESLDRFVNEMFLPMEEAARQAATQGESVGTSFAEGINLGFTNVSEIVSNAIEGISVSVSDSSKSIGENVTGGIAEGMTGNGEVISQSASTVMENVMASLQAAGEIHSPSELSKRLIGVMITEGIAEGMTSETESLAEASNKVLETIISSFENSKSLISPVGQSIVQAIATEFSNAGSSIGTIGTEIVSSFINEFVNRTGEAVEAGNHFTSDIISELRNQVKKYEEQGRDSANSFITGIKNLFGEARTAGYTLTNSALTSITGLLKNFYDAGVNAGAGLVRGIESQLNSASAAGRRIAQAAYMAAMRELDEESPSKKMHKVGAFAGIGFVEGILDLVAESYNAGASLGSSTLDGANKSIKEISQVVEDSFDTDPEINPIVNLDNVRDSVNEINKMFNDAIKITTVKAESVSLTMRQSNSLSNTSDNSDQNKDGSKDSKTGNTYQFIQTNNSPKALSRVEIYRQTKKQFSQFREAVENQ